MYISEVFLSIETESVNDDGWLKGVKGHYLHILPFNHFPFLQTENDINAK